MVTNVLLLEVGKSVVVVVSCAKGVVLFFFKLFKKSFSIGFEPMRNSLLIIGIYFLQMTLTSLRLKVWAKVAFPHLGF